MNTWKVVAEFPNGETVQLADTPSNSYARELLHNIVTAKQGYYPWYSRVDSGYVNLSLAIRLRIVSPQEQRLTKEYVTFGEIDHNGEWKG